MNSTSNRPESSDNHDADTDANADSETENPFATEHTGDTWGSPRIALEQWVRKLRTLRTRLPGRSGDWPRETTLRSIRVESSSNTSRKASTSSLASG
jgi:hypothetical protein